MHVMPDVPPRPEPFTALPGPGALEDLRAWLHATRAGRVRPGTPGWSLGMGLGRLGELVACWADGFG